VGFGAVAGLVVEAIAVVCGAPVEDVVVGVEGFCFAEIRADIIKE